MGDDGGGVKVAAAATTAMGMKQITRLRELLQKWQAMALGANKGDVATAGDEEDKEVVEVAPADVPRGYCPVYVGPEQRRFVIPTRYLGHPVFRLLLEKAEEEFGFCHQGALAIPCETEAFKYILQCVERHDNGLAAGDVVDGVVDVNDRAPPRD
uniref:Uncharacterized protein n=1 Tax=Oryza barthii TaxID=65489 RepID=A0A0D3H797_9ORYZ